MSEKAIAWWKAAAGEVHLAVFAYLKQHDSDTTGQFDEYLRWARLYSNYNALGIALAQQATVPVIPNRLTFNVVQSITDSVHARIAKNRPKPTPVTNGGSYRMQKKAKLLDLFLQGLFYGENVYDKAADAQLHSEVFGTSGLKVYVDGGEIKVDRWFLDELVVDEFEASFGAPRQIHQRRPIAREVLLADYPDARRQEIIRGAKEAPDTGFVQRRSDMVWVVESWHLPSGRGQDDGRHTITVDGGDLVDEKYKKTRFPFAVLHWKKGLKGWRGTGIPEALVGIQNSINQILQQIQECLTWAVPKAYIRRGSKIVKSHLNGDPGGIIEYDEAIPEIRFAQTVAPELFEQLDRLYSRAWELIGASQAAGSSEKPAGLNSGKALDTFIDWQSERFVMVGKGYEAFHLDVGSLVIEAARELYADKKPVKVSAVDRTVLRQIDWSDVDLKRDEYVLQMFPTSALSTTPSGRLQDVADLLQMQLITNTSTAIRLLDFPDLREVNELAQADENLWHKQIEDILEGGEIPMPEPIQNLDTGLKLAQAEYLRVRAMDDVPEERLEAMRLFIAAIATMQPPAAGTAAPQPGAITGPAGGAALPPGAPPGMPGMPPAMPSVPPPMNAAPTVQ